MTGTIPGTIPGTPTPTVSIGCDVGKTQIVVAHGAAAGATRSINNDPDSLARFAATLPTGCLVICEATGGFEAALLLACVAAGHAIHRADPRRVKAFIRSRGTLGKSDTIDARALARYGQERHPELARWQPADADRDRLHNLVMTRRDFVADQTSWRNRAQAPGADVDLITPVIKTLAAQIKALDAQIETLIAASATLRAQVATLCAIPGIGATTAVALVAVMPELGRLDRRQAASLAGLAPHPYQSGARDGYRRTRGGRPEVKRTVFMAAMAAARHHPELAAFHARLIARGKKKIVALVAVMRKLIVLCNAKLREQAQAA